MHHTQVAQKTQTLNIGRIEAIFEVYTDLVVEQAGSEDVAILWVLRQDFKEFCVRSTFCALLQTSIINALVTCTKAV